MYDLAPQWRCPFTDFHHGLLNVELAVLEKLGELTTERGDEMTARKVEAGTPFQPLTAKEAVWIQAALRGIMRRLGMKKAGAVIPPLTMTDLPVL